MMFGTIWLSIWISGRLFRCCLTASTSACCCRTGKANTSKLPSMNMILFGRHPQAYHWNGSSDGGIVILWQFFMCVCWRSVDLAAGMADASLGPSWRPAGG